MKKFLVVSIFSSLLKAVSTYNVVLMSSII